MSYNDYDLGYDLGYDSETIISNTTSAPTQAQGNPSGIVYRMLDTPAIPGIPAAPFSYEEFSRRIREGESVLPGASGPVGTPTIPDGYSEGRDPDTALAGVTGTTSPDMEFSLDETSAEPAVSTADLAAERNGRAMDSAASTLREMGWSDGMIEMFRDQHTGRSAEELTSIMNPEGVAEEGRSDAIRDRLIRDFNEDLASNIQDTYGNDDNGEPNVSRDDAMAMSQRLISSLGSLDNFTPETRADLSSRVSRERAALESGETYRDTPLYAAAVEQNRGAFTEGEALRGALTATDRTYYNPRIARGREHLDHDGDLFVEWYRTRNPELREHPMSEDVAIAELRGMGSATLRTHAEAFHEAVGRNPGRAGTPTGERDRVERMHDAEGWALSRMNPAERATYIAAREGREHDSELVRSREAYSQYLGNYYATALADHNHANAVELSDREHANRLGETMFNQGFQMMGQLINSSMEAIHTTTRGILEATSNMIAVRPMSVSDVVAMIRRIDEKVNFMVMSTVAALRNSTDQTTQKAESKILA